MQRPRGATGPRSTNSPSSQRPDPSPSEGVIGMLGDAADPRPSRRRQVPALDCSEWLVLELLGFLMTDFFKKNFFSH